MLLKNAKVLTNDGPLSEEQIKLKTVLQKAIDIAALSQANHLADQIPQGIFGRRGHEKYRNSYRELRNHGSPILSTTETESILSLEPLQQPKNGIMDFDDFEENETRTRITFEMEPIFF